MTTTTLLRIFTEDAAGSTAMLEWSILPADYGDTTLPTKAKIEAITVALFGAGKLSDAKVTGYEVALREANPTNPGGDGDVKTTQAARVRNVFGENMWETRIPSYLASSSPLDPQNKSVISTSGGLWTAFRSALDDAEIKASNPKDYTTGVAADYATTASLYDGKRGAPRPK